MPMSAFASGEAARVAVSEVIMPSAVNVGDWIECDGSLVAKADVPELYALMLENFSDLEESGDFFRVPSLINQVDQGCFQNVLHDQFATISTRYVIKARQTDKSPDYIVPVGAIYLVSSLPRGCDG